MIFAGTTLTALTWTAKEIDSGNATVVAGAWTYWSFSHHVLRFNQDLLHVSYV